jgi:hypothetical protein
MSKLCDVSIANSEAWACQPLGLKVGDKDAEIKAVFDGERKHLRVALHELEEHMQLKRAPAIAAHGLPTPGYFTH